MTRGRTPTARELYFSGGLHDAGGDLNEAERRFFRSIRQQNGTYKTTRPHRLDDLNDTVAALLPPDRPLQVMDVAISSGISTLEWSDNLHRRGVAHTMTAGDLNLGCYLVSIGRYLHILVDGSGYPLQYDIFGHAVSNPPPRRRLPLYLPPLAICRAVLRARFDRLRRIVDHSGAAEGSRIGCRPIQLVSSRLFDRPEINLVEDDIATNTTVSPCFHVVRAANILNRSYFDEATLARILANLRDRLVVDGLLVVCTTTGDDDGDSRLAAANDGTVFVLRAPGRLEILARIGAGSAVEGLVPGLAPAAALAPAETGSDAGKGGGP